jgi:hypothetical protein
MESGRAEYPNIAAAAAKCKENLRRSLRRKCGSIRSLGLAIAWNFIAVA